MDVPYVRRPDKGGLSVYMDQIMFNRTRKNSCARLTRAITFIIMEDMDCGNWLEKHFFTHYLIFPTEQTF